jgi:hypothetical protein
VHQWTLQAEDGIEASVDRVGEEPITEELVFVLHVFLSPVGDDEIVDPLEGIAKDFGSISQDLEVIFERPLPMKGLVGTVLGVAVDEGSDFLLRKHGFTSGSEAPTDCPGMGAFPKGGELGMEPPPGLGFHHSRRMEELELENFR